MGRNVTWAVVVVAAALLQTTWLDAISLSNVLPDLSVLLVVYFALVGGEERAMFTGVLAGLFQDVAGNVALGHHVLCLVVVGYVVGRISTRLVTEHPAVKVGLVFCASLAAGFLYTAIQYVQEPSGAALNAVVARVIPSTFYTALVTPIVFWFVNRLVGRHFSSHGVST